MAWRSFAKTVLEAFVADISVVSSGIRVTNVAKLSILQAFSTGDFSAFFGLSPKTSNTHSNNSTP